MASRRRDRENIVFPAFRYLTTYYRLFFTEKIDKFDKIIRSVDLCYLDDLSADLESVNLGHACSCCEFLDHPGHLVMDGYVLLEKEK